MFNVKAIFLLCMVSFGSNAGYFKDGDFDLDGIKDSIIINHEKTIQFKFTPSSSGRETSYNIEYLNSAEEGYTDLYKYNNKNYIVSYYSDFRNGSEYNEGIYRWDSGLKNFVMYMDVDVAKKNGSLIYQPKMVECCVLLGDENANPEFLSDAEELVNVDKIIKSIKSSLINKDGYIDNLTVEELSLINKHYRSEFETVLISLKKAISKDKDSDVYAELDKILSISATP